MAIKWDGFPTETIPSQQNDTVRIRSNTLASGAGAAFLKLLYDLPKNKILR